MSTRRVLIFTRLERFWHWTQMLLVVSLMVTGFGLHGFHDLISFEMAVTLHTGAALLLLTIWAFATFWLFTTGEWKQYLPTITGLWKVARFYSWGIFDGEAHPYRKVYKRKHNPLQALAYLGLKIVLFPAIWSTGIVYLLYGFWQGWPRASEWLFWIATTHTAAAFMMVAFLITHLYLLTVGHGFREHVKPMLSGFDDVDLSPEEEAYLIKSEPKRIR